MKRIFGMVLVLLTAVAVASFSPALKAADKKEGKLPYQDTSLTFEERAKDLLSRMTMEEKSILLSETAEEIPRLGIPHYYMGNEALHGVVRPGTFTVFPMPIGLASTWDPDVIFEMSTAISDEARGKNNANGGNINDHYCGLLVFWSPTINMARDPRWGRTPETYGEDPYLTGRMGVNFVRGLQGNDPKYLKAVSTPKHFAANNEDWDRNKCNAIISERALREYYLPGYKALIMEGHAQSIMGAYNAINGVPCNANKKLMTDILRGEWKFDGYVVTDCGAINNLIYSHKYVKTAKEAAAVAINAGVDIECGGDATMKHNIIDAIKSGLVTEDTLDQAVYRLLRMRFRLGVFDPPEMVPYTKIPGSVVGSKEHQQLALKIGREAIVLLKNDAAKNGALLPIDKNEVKSIAIVGPTAAVARFGDYSGTPVNEAVSPLQGIKRKTGDKVKINFAQWISAPGENDFTLVPPENLLPAGGASGDKGLKGEYFANTKLSGEPASTRTDPKVDMDTQNHPPDPAIPRGPFSARWTGKLVPALTGEYRIAVTVEGSAKLSLDGNILFERKGKKMPVFKAGKSMDIDTGPRQERKTAVVTLEAGKTYDIALEYSFVDGNAVAKLEWIPPSTEKANARAREMEMIKNSDLVLAFMGIGLDQEREGIDRADLDLPADQEEYIKQAFAANPNMVVVLVNGSPLSINWINEHVPSIVEMWYGGEQGGNAIADVLFGDYNPGGRLPVTFYKSVDQLPPFNDYEISKGRTYMYFEGDSIYPFGHGLSYTEFDYGNLKLDKKSVNDTDTVKVSVDVKNTGVRDGDEVVQLYVHDVDSSVKQPIRKLRGFRRVHLKKGETQTVTIPLAMQDLSFWDDKTNRFIVEPGDFEVLVGASSKDIRAKDVLTVAK